MKKYRAGKIKREHSVIAKLWPVLEQMAECDQITTIIPGPISPQNSPGFEITFQRFTDTGLRMLAKNGSAVQEVYVVTSQREATLQWLADQGIVDWAPDPPEAKPAAALPSAEPRSMITLPSDMACAVCKRTITAGSRAVMLGRKRFYYAHVRCAK